MSNDLLIFLVGPLGLPGLLVAGMLLLILAFGMTATRVAAASLLALLGGAILLTHAGLASESNIWPLPYLGWTAVATLPTLWMLIVSWRHWRAKSKK